MASPAERRVSWDEEACEESSQQSGSSSRSSKLDGESVFDDLADPGSLLTHRHTALRRPTTRTSAHSSRGAAAVDKPQQGGAAAAALHGAIFGVIIFVTCVPTMISYAAIVFRGHRFAAKLPTLTKLMFLSASVHMAVFSIFSSMPFAVGQVQDIGLIFLSQIAKEVFDKATMSGSTPDEALATVLVACAAATVITGVGVWVVGRLKLSVYVQLLPLPVIGGYLGYIGYFCLAAGASLGTGLTIEGFGTWRQFMVLDAILWSKLGLSLAFALLLFIISYKVKHVAALPGVLVTMPLLFFLVLLICGVSLDTARAEKWIPEPEQHPHAGWETFQLYNGFQNLAWHVLPSQIVHVICLFCVVSFGSVLDIAAIQIEQPTPLDSDAEMRMIGISNVASGLASGFTGSYIFSMTIFTQRQKVTSKMAGIILCIGEVALFLLPIDILQFFPGYFIGGIMAFFGIDIMLDWLVHSRGKVSFREYLLVWFTFLIIMFTDLITGCAIGVAASACIFLLGYSSTPAFEIKQGLTSTAARSCEETAALLTIRREIACIEFHGYLFFGAALQISEKIQKKIRKLGATQIVLDFEHVVTLDSTSAKAIGALVMSLQTLNIKMIFSAVGPREKQMYRLLMKNGALPAEDEHEDESRLVVDCMDEALSLCENRLLHSAVLAPSPRAESGDFSDSIIGQIGRHLCSFLAPLPFQVDSGSSAPADVQELLLGVASRMEERFVDAHLPVFTEGEPCNEVFVVLDGTANLEGPRKNRRGKLVSTKVVRKYKPGSLLGVLPFQVSPEHSSTCRAGPSGCKVAVLSRMTLQAIDAECPQQASLVHRIFLRHVSQLTQLCLAPASAPSIPPGAARNNDVLSVDSGATPTDV